jgi:AGCS family alanine or glycine:cation symporter
MRSSKVTIICIILLFFISNLNGQELKSKSITEIIRTEFEGFTKTIGFYLSYEISIAPGSPKITENKVIDFEGLANGINIQEKPIHKYLYDFFIEENTSRELLEAYEYEAVPSEKLIKMVSEKFQLELSKVAENHYLVVKYLAKPLAIERAKYEMNLLSPSLKMEIKNFENTLTPQLEKYISNKYGLNNDHIVSPEKKYFADELKFKIILLEKNERFDDELRLELSGYKPYHLVNKELKKALVLALNHAVYDEKFYYYFPQLIKIGGSKDVVQPKDIRSYLVAEKIVLPSSIGIPVIVLVLALGSVIFTLLYKFVNINGFFHAVEVIRGKYSKTEDKGEINHFQALTLALSATVGLGSIAGIALAINMGGPGVIFWIWITSFFGMTTKFNSCLFSQVYREFDSITGKVKGGPMYYLSKGISDVYPSISWFGKFLAILFSVFCIFASIGGGNLFQVNQAFESVSSTLHLEGDTWKWSIGFSFAIGVAFVILGGAKKMGACSSYLVPCICLFYVSTCLIIIAKNFHMIPSVLGDIFSSAFNFKTAAWGGLMSIFLTGVKRATFSNEAGLGSSSIIHATAKTDEPVREGLVAMMEPFIDTLFICTTTAFAILVTNAHLSGVGEGIKIVGVAFASVHPIFLFLLMIAVLLFAFSTLITWCYCGEKSAEYLFGVRAIVYYRIIFVACIIIGPVVKLTSIIEFSDMMMLCMAFPNIIGGILLFKKGKVLFNDYWKRLKAGEMVINKKE